MFSEEVLVCSTGKIGPQLPMEKMEPGLAALVNSMAVDQMNATAQAIMTTDTRSKQVVRDIEVGGRSVRLTGLAKGAGMIEPIWPQCLLLLRPMLQWSQVYCNRC